MLKRKMTSKNDDTLPLPGFSQELSIDVTVDEDFIPTSQPQSNSSKGSKMSKNSETNFNKSVEEPKASNPVSDSRIDDTLPPEVVMDRSTFDRNKSADFIPDTETKNWKMNYADKEMSCKKKLPIFGVEDIFKVQSNQPWDGDVSESPNAQNLPVLEDSLAKVSPSGRKCDESVTEIIVNDSAETVDLEVTPMEIKKSKAAKAAEIPCSLNLNVERCEETQIFDSSSILLLDNQCSDSDKTESVNEMISQKLYLQATLDDEESNFKEKMGVFSRPFDVTESLRSDEEKSVKIPLKNFFPKPKVQTKFNLTDSKTTMSTRKFQFKLLITCLVTLDTKTSKVANKSVTEVQEISKFKPKHVCVEPVSDSTSDKSKRQSTSSSGSVYSDKMGPFATHKRISIKSDQTDSSEEDITSIPRKEKMNLERVPWSYEYLVPLKLDDLLRVAIEDQEFLKRPDVSPQKPKRLHCNDLQEILESSSSEQTFCNLNSGESEYIKRVAEESSNETIENSEPLLLKKNQEEILPQQPETKGLETTETILKKNAPINFCDGLRVLARWTDKRYYPGVLFGNLKNDRWGVKFDDGASKMIREDFIMPNEWLKVGALVFAMTGDNYDSGQIVEVKRGEEVSYVVELDTQKNKVSVKLSDICLTDVMAGIIREKYRPLTETPRGKADIDFDNVVGGKRFREQRTPLKPSATAHGSSGEKKKSSSKAKKDDCRALHSIRETPQNDDSEKKIIGLKSENGHLVEDKVMSADSQSGTEMSVTPFRRSSKEPRKKAKPRSLSYETEGIQKKKTKSWLAPDGTPIPGPSGVKTKNKKAKVEPETPEESGKSSKKNPAEKGRRKRKLDESDEDNIMKKLTKKTK